MPSLQRQALRMTGDINMSPVMKEGHALASETGPAHDR